MKYEITIKRKDRGAKESFLQTFAFEGTGEETIAAVLDKLNTDDDLYDISGEPARKIIWSCSCCQGVCGACSMVINGVPTLACKTKLKSLSGDKVLLEPLTKFSVIADLETDRNIIYEAPITHMIYSDEKTLNNPSESNIAFQATRCIRCGICIEVCPNTADNVKNLGAAFAGDCYLAYKETGSKQEKKRMKKEFRKEFGYGCSKSLACMDNCPAGIDFRSIINEMNSLFIK